MRRLLMLLGTGLVLGGVLLPGPVRPHTKNQDVEPDTSVEDLKILKDADMKVDGPALLEYFRERTHKEVDPQLLTRLIRDLGDEDFIVRERAYAELKQLGTSALAAIRDASDRHPDTEARRRAAELRQRIEAAQRPLIQLAAARLIARIKPPGAAEVILNYLPFCGDTQVIDALCKTLGAVAVREGKVEPAVIGGLTERTGVKRAAAGEALARAKVTDRI